MSSDRRFKRLGQGLTGNSSFKKSALVNEDMITWNSTTGKWDAITRAQLFDDTIFYFNETEVGRAQLNGLIIGTNSDLSPSGAGAGYLQLDGAGYGGYATLDATAMYFGHNSSSRSLILQVNETDRLTIQGSQTSTIQLGSNITHVADGIHDFQLNSDNAVQFRDNELRLHGNTNDSPLYSLYTDGGTRIGYMQAGGAFIIQSEIHGADLRLRTEHTDGSIHNVLDADPDANTDLYSGNGNLRLSLQQTGIAALRGDNTISTGTKRFDFERSDGTLDGIIGYVASEVLAIQQRQHGKEIQLTAEDSGGTTRKTIRMGKNTTGSHLAFHDTAPIARPTVTGSRGGNAALASLLTALSNYGLITDSSS